MSMHFNNTLRNMLIVSAIWKHAEKNYISMKLGNIFARDKTVGFNSAKVQEGG